MTVSQHMQHALQLAETAAQHDEVPVGAVIVDANGTVIGQGYNLTRTTQDPTAHAEVVAIREAAKTIGNHRLVGCSLFVTLEPCAMCAGAIAHARLAKVVFGAHDPKSGGTAHGACVFDHPQSHHKPDIIAGDGAGRAAELLKNFFAAKRRGKV